MSVGSRQRSMLYRFPPSTRSIVVNVRKPADDDVKARMRASCRKDKRELHRKTEVLSATWTVACKNYVAETSV